MARSWWRETASWWTEMERMNQSRDHLPSAGVAARRKSPFAMEVMQRLISMIRCPKQKSNRQIRCMASDGAIQSFLQSDNIDMLSLSPYQILPYLSSFLLAFFRSTRSPSISRKPSPSTCSENLSLRAIPISANDAGSSLRTLSVKPSTSS